MTDQPIVIQFILEGSHQTITAEASPGELLTQVAYRAGVTIQQTCGGAPSCTDCRIRVTSKNFSEAFEPASGPELRLMGNIYHITHERLACQAIVAGSSTVLVPDAKKIQEKASARSKRWLEEKRKQHHEKSPQPKNEENLEKQLLRRKQQKQKKTKRS